MADRRVAARIAGALLALASFATQAQSAEYAPAFYVGAGAGESRHSLDERYYARFDLPETDLEQSRSSYMIYGGYRANPYLAIELNVQDLGGSDQWRARCVAFSCPQIVDFNPHELRVSTRRASLALVVIRPLGDHFELFAKLGLARSQHDAEVLFDPGSQNIDDERFYTTDRLVSAGATFLLRADWAVRLQWDRAESPLRSVRYGGTNDIESLSLALEYRFN